MNHDLFAVTGSPILHSQSPHLFQSGFRALGLQNQYLRLSARTAPEALDSATGMGILGMNVTSPHKEQMAGLVECQDEASRILEAVNTVVRSDGGWRGYNTDPQGVVGAIRGHGFEIPGAKVLVLGAGGAARAAAYSLVNAGAGVSIVNRTLEKARLWAEILGCGYVELQDVENHLRDADLLISCLAGGAKLFDPEMLNTSTLVLDADYSMGWLAKRASDAGCETIDARQWLIHQALAAFRIMVGRDVALSQLSGSLETTKDGLYNVILIGFMGSGKSSVGAALAGDLGLEFVDTDEVVQQRAGRSISDIFRSEGEAAFRAMERDVLGETLQRGSQVVACGGGAILSEHNRDMLCKSGLVVWLWAPLDVCLNRATTGTRPLLTGQDSDARAELFRERLELYAGCSDLVVPSYGSDPQKIAKVIAHEVRCIGKS